MILADTEAGRTPEADTSGGKREYDYVISGLCVRSVLELPSAIRSETRHAHPDVTIAVGDVPQALPTPDRSGKDWAIQGETFLLHLHGVLRALIRGGTSMLVEFEPGQDPDDLVLYLLGTCFAVILQQRGRVVLHASAIAVQGRAMLFCGQSGAGKSTMAALLEQRGYALLNDDVCNLSLHNGEYVVYPDGRMLKLWAESMAHLRKESDASRRVRRNLEKFYTAPEHLDLTPRPVGGVYVLRAGEKDRSAELSRLSAAEALAELMDNAYRPMLVQAMNMQAAYFQVAVTIQRSAGVYRLSRPLDFSVVNDSVAMLERHWESGR